MKQLTITFLFSIISIFCFAQTPFTEKIVQDMSYRLINNPAKFCKEDLAPTFVITGSEGHNVNYEQITKLIMESKQISRILSDIKVKQYGNVATATGSLVHVFMYGGSQTVTTAKERFTYIHEYSNGKWQIVHAQHTPIQANASDEEAAIKKVVTDHTQSSYDRDATKMLSFWVNSPQSAFVLPAMNVDLVGYDNIANTVTNALKNIPPSKAIITQKFRTIKIQGNSAWVSHDEIIDDGGITAYLCHRYLEKVNGEWKISQSASIPMMTKEDNPENVLKQFVAEYNKNNTAFFMDRCPDNFRYTNGEGKFSDKEALKSDKTHTSDSEVSDMKVFQRNNLGVVSGIHIWKDATMKVVRKVAFTYTLEKVNGKWLFAASHHTPVKE